MAVSLPRGQLTSRAGRVLPIDTGAPGRRSLWSSGGSEQPQQHPRALASGSAPCPGTGPGESATSIPAESSGKGAGAIDHSPTAPTDLRTVTSTRRTPSVLCLGAGTPPGPADLTAWVLRLFRPSIPSLPVQSYSRALEHSRCRRGRVPVPGIPDTRLLRLGCRQSQPFAPGGLLAQSGESDQARPSKTHEGSSYRDLGDTRSLGTRTSEPTRPKVGGWGAHSQPLGMGGTTCVPARFPNPWMLLTRPQRHPPVAGSGRRPRAEERLRIHKTPCLRRIYRGPSFGNPVCGAGKAGRASPRPERTPGPRWRAGLPSPETVPQDKGRRAAGWYLCGVVSRQGPGSVSDTETGIGRVQTMAPTCSPAVPPGA